MDALALLKQDHQEVKALMQQAEASEDPSERLDLFSAIKTALEMHTHIEEEIFYPALEIHEELKDLAVEAYEEHQQVKTLLEEIDDLSEDDETFAPKLKVLRENVEHHAEHEEEAKMFPLIRKLFDSSALNKLGQKLAAEKIAYAEEED